MNLTFPVSLRAAAYVKGYYEQTDYRIFSDYHAADCRRLGDLELLQHAAGVEPFDDMAILVLFMNEVSPGRDLIPLAVSFASFDAVREAVIREVGDTQEARMFLLAADEALANIVRYSGATELAFEVTVEGDVLGITFRDNGIPFDPTVFDIEVKEFEELDGGGMGLGLIRQSVSSARYVREDGRNLFTMQFFI